MMDNKKASAARWLQRVKNLLLYVLPVHFDYIGTRRAVNQATLLLEQHTLQ